MGSKSVTDNVILINFLFENLVSYLKHNSKSEAALDIGVDRSVLNRIIQKKSILLENAIPTIKFFTTKANRRILLKEILPELAEFFEISYNDEDGDIELSPKTLNDLTKENSTYYKVFAYAGFNSGITKQEILKMYGEDGLFCLEEMLDLEILFCSGSDKIKTKGNLASCTDIDTILARIKSNINSFDKEGLKKHQIGGALNIDGTTSTVGLKFLRLLIFFNAQLIGYAKKQSWFKGDKPYFLVSLCGSFNKHERLKLDLEEYKNASIEIGAVTKDFLETSNENK